MLCHIHSVSAERKRASIFLIIYAVIHLCNKSKKMYKWNAKPCLWIGLLIIRKMSIHPKLIHRFIIRENGGNVRAMKGLGEGRSRRKERRKWALLPPTQPTSPPPEGPRTAEIWGLKWRLWKPERWSEEGERPGLISPRLSLLPHPLWCCSLKIFPVSQSLVGVPGLLSLSGFSHPLYPLPGSGVRVEGGQGGGNLFCYIGTGLGKPCIQIPSQLSFWFWCLWTP